MYAEIDGQGWGEVYASAKYMDLLHETGKNTDAREAFIHPQYKKNDAGDQIPAFRFVANLYRTERFPVMYIVRVRQRK